MKTAHIAVVMVALVVVVAACAYMLRGDDPAPPADPVAAELSDYTDGIYDMTLAAGSVELAETDLASMGSTGAVFVGGGWASAHNPVEYGSAILALVESGGTVASDDTSVFDCLRDRVAYTFEDGASVNAVRLNQESGMSLCFSGTHPAADDVLDSLADWMDGEHSLARYSFDIGSLWKDRVMAVSDHGYGSWGRAVTGSYYGFCDSNGSYASVHCVMFCKEEGAEPESAAMRLVSGEGILLDYAPGSSTVNISGVTYDVIGVSGAEGQIRWYHNPGVEYSNHSDFSDRRFEATLGIAGTGGVHQLYFCYGAVTSAAGGTVTPFSESGSLELRVSAGGAVKTFAQETKAFVPAL